MDVHGAKESAPSLGQFIQRWNKRKPKKMGRNTKWLGLPICCGSTVGALSTKRGLGFPDVFEAHEGPFPGRKVSFSFLTTSEGGQCLCWYSAMPLNLQMSHNENPVQAWLTQNHASRVKKAEFRCYLWQGNRPGKGIVPDLPSSIPRLRLSDETVAGRRGPVSFRCGMKAMVST